MSKPISTTSRQSQPSQQSSTPEFAARVVRLAGAVEQVLWGARRAYASAH